VRITLSQSLVLIAALLLSATGTVAQKQTAKPDASTAKAEVNADEVVGKRITLSDGRSLLVDDAWKQGTAVWYSRGGVTQSIERDVVKIEPVYAPPKKTDENISKQPAAAPKPPPEKSIWIYLVGGARFKVDDVNETSEGAWYHRGTVSVFVDRERIARIERENAGSTPARYKGRDWTSGNEYIDQLIKTNAELTRLDPYLVFLVIEQESQFRVRARSPKGAQGLMQLMPGTARRFGVKRPYEAAENIRGGTMYLRELMDLFGGQVNLVLASYNAGEGAVMKYGRNVPPYRETREYVKKIGKRYGLSGRQPEEDENMPSPRR
jgi:Transglycosylase SLT domain